MSKSNNIPYIFLFLSVIVTSVLLSYETTCASEGVHIQPRASGTKRLHLLSPRTALSPAQVVSNWTDTAPTPDGHIQSSEWADAAVYDITAGEVYTETVQLYVMNDASYLYLAIDNPNDIALHESDQIGIHFDDNPLSSDGQWTNTSCGNPDGEGSFLVGQFGRYYREIVAGAPEPEYCNAVDPAPGVSGIVGKKISGPVQAEVAIDLITSALRASPGDAIGMYLWMFDADTNTFYGQWPSNATLADPATFGTLRLATVPPPPCLTPEIPQLLAPADGANVGATPNFDWSDAADATAYRIQVDDAKDFLSPVISVTVTTSTFMLATPLAPGTYYWHVQGWNNGGGCNIWGWWSAPRSVRVQVPVFMPIIIKR